MVYNTIGNDVYSPLGNVLSEKHFIKLEPGETLPHIPKEYDIIFDLGGHIDHRAIEIMKLSDWIIISTARDLIDIQAFRSRLTGLWNFVNNFGKYGFLRRTPKTLIYLRD